MDDDRDVDHNRRLFLELSAMGAAGLLAGLENEAEAAETPKTLARFASGNVDPGGRRLPPTSDDWPPLPPGAPENDDGYINYRISVDIHEQELAPGVKIHTLAFEGDVPGPLLRVPEGAWVKVDFENRTTLNHTIHWHGLDVPYPMDGVPLVTQPPVRPFKSYTYRFRAIPYGTHFYHCHWGAVLHIQSGMYGGFIVESDDDPILKKFGYDREEVLILSAIDTDYVRVGLNEMLVSMAQRMRLYKEGRLSNWQTNQFDSIEHLLGAMEQGYQPPYLRSQSGRGPQPHPEYYTINGRCYPLTPKIKIRQGERIRVRLINAGFVDHFMHLHGHQFYRVCDDGFPLPYPILENTVRVSPGKTTDIIIEGSNPGIWTFHDHDTRRSTNNGSYPGGALTLLVYEGFDPAPFQPKISLGE